MSTPHGTHSKYARGCRCNECREAHRVYTAARRKAALAAGTLSHGRRSTFDAGCRCPKCRATRQIAYLREYEPKSGRRRLSDPYAAP